MKALLIDDHALFRAGLESLLERRGIEIVASVGSGEDAIRLVRKTTPDVILLDLRMPEISGLDVLKTLSDQKPGIPVVMLTTSSEEQDLAAALRKGARGYLMKDMEPDELVIALRDIVAGNTVVAPALTGVLADLVKNGNRQQRKETEQPFTELTPREREILGHLAEGQSNKVIARHLDISDGTVKLHVKAILRKLGVHSRVEAAVMAVEHGIRRVPQNPT
ncbi:MAG: response regulator transcription factor [Arenicellales bacterium]|jgi:two-component system nitrate/nitrite response regulator NarL|nr:two-component system response regulator NarL [Acidiferrobacteraceae bacterium]MDP6136656.1 response regulator transcription factor [Arenicellales bacterium]MDP6392621.1 response regulator transcription factor [Arenicellales bacterium]MDP7221299.1 response regulator transcription factor [Arenicellales bacterium]HJP09079.1 response regulator transcription factor [Arenicellales bacterium]|tara:strand:- start:4562 stop:5224 length:663 start_codon:yes stop_codon:yes gene_type:complete